MAFGTILVPYDASDAADAMLRLACMAVRERGRVVAVHIARIPPALPLERSPDVYEWAGHIALDRAECIAADMGSGLETWMTRTRDPEEAILGEARKQEVDAIFLSRHSWRHPWRRLREARTVHAVLRRAPCAVLVGTAGRPIRPDPSGRIDETTSGSDSSRRRNVPYGSFGIVERIEAYGSH